MPPVSRQVHARQYLRAICFSVAGFAFWSVGDALLKLCGSTEAPKYEIMGLSGIGGMIVVFCFTAVRGNLKRLRPHHYRGLFGVGVLYLFSFMFALLALPRLPLASYYTVLFLAPSIVVAMASRILHEKMSWKHITAIAVGFLGVLIAINPASLFSDKGNWAGYGLAFMCTLILATQMLCLRILGPHETRECLAFWPRTMAIVGCLFAVFLWGDVPLPFHIMLFGLLSGGVGSIGWLCLAESYKLAPASAVAPFHYSQIVSGAFLGYLIWGDVPHLRVFIGASVIIASGVYIVTHIRKSGQMPKALAENP